MKLERRSVFGWGPSAAGYANPRNGIAVHYDGSNQGLANKQHESCRTYWKNTRKFHMGPSRGWADIGYSFSCCPHGIVMEGRGLNKQQAAQPGGNSTWYSCTLMTGPSEAPTDAQIRAFRELRAWLMGKGVAGAVRGHRDFVSTSCPGDRLYTMVRDGTFSRAPQIEEDDMEPTTTVKITPYWKESGQFSHDSYSAAFLWQGSVAETRAYGKRILAALEAQRATIDKLVEALALAAPDMEALKADIREAIESVTVRLDVEDEPAPGGGA